MLRARRTSSIWLPASAAWQRRTNTPSRDVLNTLVPFCAVALGVTLYALTRDVDEDLALLGMALRLSKRRLAMVKSSSRPAMRSSAGSCFAGA